MCPTAAAARRDLARIVGEDAVQVPVADRSLLRDMTETRGLAGDALGAVFPGSTEEVAAVVRWCARADVPFVPRGGGTGYVGGAMPDAGSLVIALARMARLREAVPQAWRMTVEAGLTARPSSRSWAGTSPRTRAGHGRSGTGRCGRSSPASSSCCPRARCSSPAAPPARTSRRST
jgi:hypothetical protein